jgi:serine O-acetyltransferase
LALSFLSQTKEVLLLDYLPQPFTKDSLSSRLVRIEDMAFSLFEATDPATAREKTDSFLSSLPDVRRLLFGSLKAILNGDPAASSFSEIVLCYPGFEAILNYRIAHVVYQLGDKVLARIFSEAAHRDTGIDINPGATIGRNFFIDHGTGIVIGETASIGNDVKLYQGVTLGAKSLAKGRMLSGLKRHPTVEDGCTIYSNASILGGTTVIGASTTVGANVYLTSSVPPRSIVYLGNSGIRIIPKVEEGAPLPEDGRKEK